MMDNDFGSLRYLPCIDSAEMSAARRAELDVPRKHATMLGVTSVEAAQRGYYTNMAGEKVDWRKQVEQACSEKRSIRPDDVLPAREIQHHEETRVQVVNETTLQAARRLTESGRRPLALNFANGVHPGGGFLNGARAQEEVLCRSSALHSTLINDLMYEYHRQRLLPDSSDWAIYSPDVPVFRLDDGTPHDEPWSLSFITSAAPYAPRVGQPTSGDLLRRRIWRILDIGSALGYETLVLGAWGCGAFGNDPNRTAADFREALETTYRGHFAEVVFAVTDWSPERKTLGPFRDVFSDTHTALSQS
jgi:uncharacterized protein (TIGR02452 family)